MILFAIVIYVLFLVGLYKVTPSRGDNSIFGFRNLFFIMVAAELPFVVTVALNPDVLHERVRLSIYDFEGVFFKFLLLKSLFLVMFTITAFHIGRNRVSRHRRAGAGGPILATPALLDLKLAVVMLVLALASFLLLVREVGGFSILIASWSNKSEILQGTALIRTLNLVTGMMSVAFLISYIGKKRLVTLNDRLVLTLFMLLTLLTLVAVGERKNPVLVIVFAMVVWHYRVRPINFLNLRYAALLLVLMGFAAVFPELRRADGMELFFSDPGRILAASASNWGQLFARVSDIETSLFIYSYFDSPSTYWYGASYPDLVTGLIPSQFMPDKPPVDEGVYIYALSFNVHLTPPVPFRSLFPVGWPVSRVTGPFVHFGVLGVLFGGLLTGFVMRHIHEYAFRAASPASIFIYVWAMFTGFGLTNAYVFNLMIILVLLIPIELYCRSAGRRRARGAWRRMPVPSR